MSRPSFSRHALALCALAAASTVALADGGRDRVEARLKGYQEVPAVSSAASGRFKAKVDAVSGTMTYELSYSGLEGPVRMAHIHIGQRGANGGVMVWLCQTANFVDPTGGAPTCPQMGTVTGTIQASNVVAVAVQGIAATEFAEMLAAIRAGVAYVNVHSDRYPPGEIRGQLKDDD
jgi:CHRD domain